MKKLLAFAATCFFLTPVSAQERCLSVDGLQFEAVDYSQLLVIKSGKNIAIARVRGYIGDLRKVSRLEFRFFAPTVCTISNSQFQINGSMVDLVSLDVLK
jgi:hypothetical protein